MISPTRQRKRLSSAERQELYDSECLKARAKGRGLCPLCAICDLPILPGQQWHDNHDKYLPHAIGGKRDGISHARCNREHGHKIATPQVAKFKRIVRKHLDIHRSSQPMQGGRTDRIMKKLTGDVVNRKTGERAS